jgi:very-short-patch-repair endonuclease
VAIEDIKLAIEVDVREHHSREIDFENDRVRNNQFVEAGWTVLHFTWRQLTQEPDAMISVIRATIARLRPP